MISRLFRYNIFAFRKGELMENVRFGNLVNFYEKIEEKDLEEKNYG